MVTGTVFGADMGGRRVAPIRRTGAACSPGGRCVFVDHDPVHMALLRCQLRCQHPQQSIGGWTPPLVGHQGRFAVGRTSEPGVAKTGEGWAMVGGSRRQSKIDPALNRAGNHPKVVWHP
jgi:hypothetical protein